MADCGLCVAYHEDYRVVFRNEDAISMVITNPYNAGHLIILPRRHVLELGNLTANESLAVNEILFKSQQRLIEVFPDSPPVLGMNSGIHSTQPHLHYQMLPSDISFRGFYRAAHPQGALEGAKEVQAADYPIYTEKSLEEIARLLRP